MALECKLQWRPSTTLGNPGTVQALCAKILIGFNVLNTFLKYTSVVRLVEFMFDILMSDNN